MSQRESKIKEENKNQNMNNYYELRPTIFGTNFQKPKKEGKFTLSTIIYDKFGKGENKKKRYEKITNEIKIVEQNSKKEIIKLTNQILNIEKKLNEEKEKENDTEEYQINIQNRSINLQQKKLALLELEKDKRYNYLEVIHRLKIPPEKRTTRDILRIKTYLTQSKLGLNITEEFTDKNISEKIINFCCIEMRYKNFKKGDIIIKIGERLDSFYSIILGKINIMKPFKKKVKITGFEYFKYLMELKKNKENYIINLCIRENEQNYVIEPDHIDIIHYIYLLNYLDYIHINKKPANQLDDIINLIDLNPIELNLDPNKLTSEKYTHDYLKTIKKKLPNISHILFDQYSFFNEYSKKNEVYIFEYKKVNTLKTNDFFGESNAENKGPMNETIIADEDCEVAALSHKLYSEQIISEKILLLDKKISDLHQNHFFRLIKFGKFSKKYFKLFINEKYNKGDIIFNEGDEIKYIYFIQEGTVQLNISKSINEIEFLIDVLLDKKDIIEEKSKSEIDLKDLTEDYYSFEQDQYQVNNISYMQTMNNNEEIDINYLNQKQNNKLIILNSNEDIGLISLILGNNYINSCSVISNTANIYKLEINYLKYILAHESEFKEEFFERMKNKIDVIKERLSIISNIKLVMKGKKEVQKEPTINDIETKKLKNLRNSNIKTQIDYDKINNCFEIKTELDSSYNKLSSSPQQQGKLKIETINLPPLNSYRKKENQLIHSPNEKNVSNTKEEDSNEMSKSKIIGLMKKGLMFNLNEVRKKKMINQKQRIKSAKKWKLEDKMISKILKDIKDFSKNKFNISIDKSSKKKNNKIMSYSNKNSDKIYLTQLNILNNIKPFPETEREKDKTTNKNSHIQKNEIKPFPIKIHTLEKIFAYSDKNKKDEKTIQNNYGRLNTDENILNKMNNENKRKRINHSYKNPLTLIKQEKYKIFERKNTNNKYNIDYLSESIDKMKKLKKIYSNMKYNSSLKYRNKKY